MRHKRPEDHLDRIRHSFAHVLAQAVLALRPGSTLGFGPAIDAGFYYDFILSAPITEADFPAIEAKMREIIRLDQPFERESLGRDAALARIDEMGEPYKREYAQVLLDERGLEALSFYRNGPFMDMCEGPHVARTGALPRNAFKLRSVAGAYWRGDSANVMMSRIYAWAFASKAALKAHVSAFEAAQEREHRKLGRALELFVIDDVVGKGLPLWLPKGTVIRDELEKLMRELEFKAGYQRVATPHLTRVELYEQTGHLPYYADHMFPIMEVGEADADGVKEAYCLRPMNCPHHHRIFASRPRSYRELPLRLAEHGQVYRFEDSGTLSGLLRVRGMCMNDAHIYCDDAHVIEEFVAVMNMHREVYSILGLSDYHMRFSRWDPEDAKGKQKFIDDPEGWARAEEIVEVAMREAGFDWVEGKGEAAFYGPKIDVQFRMVTGREETASTNQLDFGVAQRLGLSYTGSDNQPHQPYIIHRAPLGTHERFVALLIEHHAGAFPTWLSPVQARVLPVSDRFAAYGARLVEAMRGRMIRAELDASGEKLGKKLRDAFTEKVPNLLIVGEREMDDGSVTLRRLGSRRQQSMPFDAFLARIEAAIAARSDAPLEGSGGA